MFYILFFLIIEIAFSIIAVNKYWRYRVVDLGTPEGNWITKVGITMAMVFMFQFMNMFLVLCATAALVEAARKQLMDQKMRQDAIVTAPDGSVAQAPQTAATPVTPVKAARRVSSPSSLEKAPSAKAGMDRYKVKKP